MHFSGRSSKKTTLASILALFAAIALQLPARADDAASDAIKKCDALASHPNDPGRYAAGVTDEQFAPGAAIEACETAHRLNPDNARIWFELGRSYWIGQRDKDAFSAFAQAAKRNYAPAMKYIGDAYLTGRGLPSTEKQDGLTALDWYKKSANAGFLDGIKATEQTEDKQTKNEFDPSIFQKPEIMSGIYMHIFHKSIPDSGIRFYINAFITEMHDKVVFLTDGASCTTLISSKTAGMQAGSSISAYSNIPQGSDMISFIQSYDGAGQRDALTLFNRYGCSSDVTKRVMNNINSLFDQSIKPDVGDSASNGGQQPPRQRQAASNEETAPPPAPAQKPSSLDCVNGRHSGIDYEVCAYPELADAVGRLETAYRAALASGGASVRTSQIAWWSSYGQNCGLPKKGQPSAALMAEARPCVLNAINRRIDDLKNGG